MSATPRPTLRRGSAAVLTSVLAAALAPALTGAATATPSVARGTCDTGYVTITTTKGQTVWVPSSRSAGPFQFGGHQELTVEDGELSARTKGSADTVGGSAGLSFGIGEASAEYNHEWNRSTTREVSYTRSFTTASPEMPRKAHWRWRLYNRGFKFTATKTKRIPTPCTNAGTTTRKLSVVVPTRKQVFTFAVEKYATRGWLLNSKGEPIRR